MLVRFLLLLMCAALFGGSSVAAQPTPSPERLLRQWLVPQAEHARQLTRLAMTESAEWSLDGPFRESHFVVEANVVTGSAVDGWQREVTRVRAGGRDIAPQRWEQIERRRAAFGGRGADAITRGIFQFPHLLRQMVPVGKAVPEDLDGVAVWRIDVVPRAERLPIERATLWLERGALRLVRSRIIVEQRASPAPVVVTTDYARIDDFDLPRHLFMEGSMQRKRRMRTFTMLFEYQATYTDYDFSY